MKYRRKSVRWNTMRILAAGFLGVILLGGVLLWLPISNQQPIAFIDALFTSTSAVCVTGLVTITPQVQFTLFGKIVLLLLIQVGGLGVVACIASFFFLLRKRITVKERTVIQEAYNMDRLGGIVGMLRRVIVGVFLVEGAGALFYAFQFVPEYGWIKGLGYSIFHAVSAFCNAGIDVLGSTSLSVYSANPLVNLTTMALIVLGGLGFVVWFDVLDNFRRLRKRRKTVGAGIAGLKLHSKLVILMTAVLLVVGTVVIFLMEYRNPQTMGGMSTGEKLLASAFQSVTTRTAGFFTMPQGELYDETKLFCSILMFIGGSPAGTAGGIKTTTIAMLLLSCLAVVRGGKDIECFGRKITFENFRTGFAVTVLAFGIFIGGTMLIAVFEADSVALVDIIYETTSAIGTVGLTADLTPHLERASQVVLMLLMYTGRIGPITLALVFAGKTDPKARLRELPGERVMVG